MTHQEIEQAVSKVVMVVLPIRGGISLSFCGVLKCTFGKYHIEGNPTLLFSIDDVSELEYHGNAVQEYVVRLKS